MLTSWKEIARFVGKSVRTVQRWERMLGLPVHRPERNLSGIVLADPAELETWMRSQPEASLAKLPAACARCAEMEQELRELRAKFAALESGASRASSRRAERRPAA